MRKIIAPLIAVALLGAIVSGVWYSHSQLQLERATDAIALSERQKQATLKGLIGSEKEAFFADVRVQKVLAGLGLTVTVEKAGSRTIAKRFDPEKYDFGFPSGAPAAFQLQAQAKASNVYRPFYTPFANTFRQP